MHKLVEKKRSVDLRLIKVLVADNTVGGCIGWTRHKCSCCDDVLDVSRCYGKCEMLVS